MSTTKDVSENPQKKGVTAPANAKAKAQDINQKLALFGVIEAMREGKYPSNAQCISTLDYALDTKNAPVNVRDLSKEGRMLVQDFQNIIRTCKDMIAKKNADELFQNFLFHTRQVDYSKGNLAAVNPAGADKDTARKDADQAVEHLRTLLKLIITNSEARKLMKDIGILGRDVAADAAAKLSDVARPDDHELAKADEPAPSNQWVGPNGETRSHNEPVPDTGVAAKVEQAKAKKEEVKQEAQQEAKDSANRVAKEADGAQQGQGTDEDRANAAANAGSEQAQAEKKRLQDKLTAKIPDKHIDNAKEQVEKVKGYAKDKFPEERRERFIYRLKKVVVENQRHRDYQEAIEFFLDRAEHYQYVAKDATSQAADKGLDVRGDSDFQKAEHELRTLLERFANGASMQPIFDAVNQLYSDAKNDSELTQWFKKLDSYVRRVLQEPGFIMKDASDKEGRQLMDEGKRFWDPKEGKYAGHKDRLFDSVTDFFTSYADDPVNVQLGEDVKKLTKDLLMDADGNLKFKPHLWNDIREVILPSMATNIGYVPIPRIEYTDNQIDAVIENLTLDSQNLLPNIVEIEARNYFKMSPYAAIKDQSKHSFTISFSQIQTDLKDVAYHIKKKTGFPRLTDSGLADIVISGKGISGKVTLESTNKPNHAFIVKKVDVSIDRLHFKVHDSKFSLLITTFRPLLSGLIKKAIAAAMQEGIRAALVQVDQQISDINERMEAAKQGEDGLGRIDALKSALTQKKEHAEQKAEANKPSGQSQILFTPHGKRDSRLVDWSSKNSIIEAQAKKQELANAGPGWKSPAFDILPGGHNNANTTTTRTGAEALTSGGGQATSGSTPIASAHSGAN